MDTQESDSKKSWSELAADARAAEAPSIDVRTAVMAEIRRTDAALRKPATRSLLGDVSDLFGQAPLRPALAAMIILAGGIAFGGFRGLDLIDLFNSLIL